MAIRHLFLKRGVSLIPGCQISETPKKPEPSVFAATADDSDDCVSGSEDSFGTVGSLCDSECSSQPPAYSAEVTKSSTPTPTPLPLYDVHDPFRYGSHM
jgi:hypothetical protein